MPACQVQQLFTGEDALRVFDEDQQQIELAGRERNHHVVRRAQFTAGDVEVPVGKVDQGSRAFLCQWAAVVHAAQHGTDPG
ncbi:hypothetical protein D3C80_2114330 [compost metagenome]